MPNMATVVSQAGQQLGLESQSRQFGVYGELDGYPIQLTAGRIKNTDCVAGLIRHGSEDADEAIRGALAMVNAASAGIKPEDVKVEDGFVVYTQKRGFVRNIDVQSVKAAFDEIFRAVKSSSEPPPRVCRLCGSAEVAGVKLLDGVVDRVCVGCIDKIHSAVAEARAAYDAVPTNYVTAAAAGLVLAVVGAVVWAGIGIAIERMFWIVGIGIGLLVGFGVSKSAGKGGAVIQVMCIAFTVFSVLLGQLFLMGYVLREQAAQEGAYIDWGKFAAAAPDLLIGTGSETVFALGAGLIGAYYAARMAGRVKIDVQVEA